jgi:hypothetical protein
MQLPADAGPVVVLEGRAAVVLVVRIDLAAIDPRHREIHARRAGQHEIRGGDDQIPR